VESETSFVRSQSRVVLDTETSVDLNIASVVLPDNTELYDTLWNLNDVESFLILWVGFDERLKTPGQLIEGLLSFMTKKRDFVIRSS
jgi:hypothetical protein